MERSTIFNGKIHYKWPFSIAMLVYQRVINLFWAELGSPNWRLISDARALFSDASSCRSQARSEHRAVQRSFWSHRFMACSKAYPTLFSKWQIDITNYWSTYKSYFVIVVLEHAFNISQPLSPVVAQINPQLFRREIRRKTAESRRCSCDWPTPKQWSTAN